MQEAKDMILAGSTSFHVFTKINTQKPTHPHTITLAGVAFDIFFRILYVTHAYAHTYTTSSKFGHQQTH